MRNNPAFQRVLAYVDKNNATRAQIEAATKAQIERVMWPPDGVRPAGDNTRVESVLKALVHVYRERLRVAQAAKIVELLNPMYPAAIAAPVGAGQYLVTIGDGDE